MEALTADRSTTVSIQVQTVSSKTFFSLKKMVCGKILEGHNCEVGEVMMQLSEKKICTEMCIIKANPCNRDPINA